MLPGFQSFLRRPPGRTIDRIEALGSDPARADLYRKIIRTIIVIRRDPGTADARRQAWRTEEWGQVWAVPVHDAGEEWVVVWTPEEPETVIVLYVGEAVS